MERPSFFARYAWPIVFVFAAATPLLFWGAGKTVLSNTNKVEDWLPQTYTETGELRWFRNHFEADQFVIVSWEGCTLGGNPADPESVPDDPRIEKLAQLLRNKAAADGAPPIDGHAQYFKSVLTARELLRQLTDDPTLVSYNEAVNRLKGGLIGPDGQQTCLLVTLTLEAIHDLRGAIGQGRKGLLQTTPAGLLWQAIEQAGIDPQTVRIGGPPVDNVAIDEEGEKTLVRLAGLSGILGLVLAWWSLRSIRLTMIVFTCGVLSAALGMALVHFTGSAADAVLLSMPPLVYVLGISGAVHLINYYHETIAEAGLPGAPERALAHGGKAALLCSVTTAIGLASLYAAEIVPIRKFGIYSAAGVMGMLVVLFLFLPAALQIWPSRHIRSPEKGKRPYDPLPTAPVALTTRSSRIFGRLAHAIIGHHGWVLAGCLLVIGVVGYGVTRVDTSIDLLKLFDSNSKIIADYQWLETHLGRLVPMEIVLKFPPGTQEPPENGAFTFDDTAELTFLERIETVALAQGMIESRFGREGQNVIGASMSAATFAPPLTRSTGGMAAIAKRTATNKSLRESRDAFIKSGYLQIDEDGTELWRISVRVAAFQNVDYGLFAHDLKEAVEPVLAAHYFRGEVLRKLDARAEGGGTAGARIVLWYPGRDSRETDAPPKTPTEILDASLGEMLTNVNADVNTLAAPPAKIKDKNVETLKKMDSVVLLGEFSTDVVERLEEEGVPIVDARPHALAVAQESDETGGAGRLSAVYTGVVPIVYKAQRALLDSLIQSTLYSFLTITPLMMFVTRSVPAGLIVMLPNVLPILVIFGGMGWLGIPVDIGSMMSASIALGVAVDDTIHYLAWFRDDFKRLGDRHKAIEESYRKCGTPTLQAALISGLGLSVFAFSTFTPTQRFGWLMLTILIAGVVAELVMLPALLAGPLGRVFRVKKQRPAAQQSAVSPPHAYTSKGAFHKEEIAKRAAGG